MLPFAFLKNGLGTLYSIPLHLKVTNLFYRKLIFLNRESLHNRYIAMFLQVAFSWIVCIYIKENDKTSSIKCWRNSGNVTHCIQHWFALPASILRSWQILFKCSASFQLASLLSSRLNHVEKYINLTTLTTACCLNITIPSVGSYYQESTFSWNIMLTRV